MSMKAQLPTGDEIFLDHLAHFVPDMKAAEAALARLGFTLTPFTAQNNRTPEGGLEPAGTGNRCAMLRNGYLEFLTKTSDTPLAQRLEAALARYTGVHLLAMAVADAEAAAARLEAQGFRPQPPVHLTRRVEDGEGREEEARFTVARVAPETMPEGRIQILTHHTEPLVWQERWLDHENRVVSLEAALVIVADPREAAQRYARFLDRPAEALDDGRFILRLDRGSLAFASDGHPLAGAGDVPRIVGHGLGSADPEATRARFLAAGCEEIAGADARERHFRLPPELGGFATILEAGETPSWAR
jgi:hypothetical protein